MAAAAAAERYEQPGRSPAKQASRRRKPSSSAAAEEDDNDEDDAWADRLWQDMQVRQHTCKHTIGCAAELQSIMGEWLVCMQPCVTQDDAWADGL